jgi:glycosyltransferase involved in cell wall biosynthesis
MPETGPRVLHASLVPRISQGIATQLVLERRAVRALGIPWETALFSPRSSLEPFDEPINMAPPDLKQASGGSMPDRIVTNIRLRRAFHSWLAVRESEFDVILLRYSVHDRAQARFVQRSRAFTGLVHHAFEVDELQGLDGVTGRVRASLESRIGPSSIRGADLIVGVTDEIAHHEVSRVDGLRAPVLVYPNGGPDAVEPVADERMATPHLLCASSYFSPWQGVDLLLDSLRSCPRDFVLHLAGELSSRDAAAAAGDSRVVVHGPITRAQMRDLAAVSWAGVSSMAMERQGMRMACPLKVREYLSMGLPVVGNYDEVLPAEFPFYVNGGPDIASILDAADRWRSIPRAVVAEASLPLISKKAIVGGFYADLARLVESSS